MTTGHPSKAALGAARIALLVGVSAAALSLSIAAAHADGLVYKDTLGNDLTQPNYGYNGVTGVYQNINSATFANTTGFTTSVGSAGLTTSGYVTVTDGASNQVLDGYGLGSTSATGNSTYLSGDNLTMSNGAGTTISLNSTDGSASFAGGAAKIDGSGNIHTDGTLTVGGATNLNGGVVVVGGTKTDTLTVTNGADITGGTKTDTLTVTDKSTFGVAGNTTIGANGSVTVGTNQNKAPLTVNGVTTLNGNTTVNGNTQLNGNLSIANGGNVSMGNNVVHDVGTPIVGTDATNKAYVDKGLNKAYEGTAIALAISQPVFLPGQTFAVRGGWGGYEGQSAFGVSAAGVIAHNVIGYGSTLALDGGIGVGSNNGVAGKAGLTVGFGGGSAPLK